MAESPSQGGFGRVAKKETQAHSFGNLTPKGERPAGYPSRIPMSSKNGVIEGGTPGNFDGQLNNFSHNTMSINRKLSFYSSFGASNGFRSFQRSTAGGNAPRVSIQSIIRKKADLYWDEDLANNFDDLLDSGFNLVSSKKQEREMLRLQEESLRSEILTLEKELIPELNLMNKLKASVEGHHTENEKYRNEIDISEKEISELKEAIANRKAEIDEIETKMSERIKTLEKENNDLKSEIAVNRTNHRRDKEEFEKIIKSRRAQQENLTQRLYKLKDDHERKRADQAERLRKMENKSKMFLGILKH
eukprot:TRINITY_DN173_c0_g1_i1.p1 TRINITY_DN173_c0_g1~~TRINITY_DN173_c0_g1_i1.p1  ORF type:complete len:304 (-),score=84.83 TRINITY_DN173_c0_g1_i1:134-1045(-)